MTLRPTPLHRAGPDWFVLGNDEFPLTSMPEVRTLAGVASPHLLHVLAGCGTALRRLLVIDVHPPQIAWLRRLIALVLASRDRIAYVGAALDVAFAEPARDRLMDVVDTTPGRVLGSRAGSALLSMERALWSGATALGSVDALSTGTIGVEGLRLDSTLLDRSVPQTASIVGCRRDGDGCYGGTFAFGCGYLADEAAFAAVRETLGRVAIEYQVSDLATEAGPLAANARREPTALYASNVFHRFFVSYSPGLIDAAGTLAQSPVKLIIDHREPDMLIAPMAALLADAAA